MREEQKLYPQLIYRINNALSELKTEFKENKDLLISPSVLNPYNRTFHWLLVAEGRWNLTARLMSGIQKKIKDSQKEWNTFKNEFKEINKVKSVADAINIIENIQNIKPEEYYSTLLSLYQFYPINHNKYFEGIIYKNLIRRAKKSDGENHRIDYAEAELLITKRKSAELYPPVDIVFYYGEQPEPKRALSQGKNNTKISNNNFHKNYLLPFFVKYENTFNPKKFWVPKPEHFSKFQFLYVIPLYDALYGKYGNICGILIIFFNEPNKRKLFKSKAKNKLSARLSSYVEEIKRAALFEILQQPIETDLLEHYVKWLPMLQDWEYIRVFENKNGGKVILNYCYGRAKNGAWKKCPLRGSNCKTKPECLILINANSYELEDIKLKKIILDAKKKHIPYGEISFGKGHMHKALLEDIFTGRYIPELDEYDKALCKDKIIIYEYPPYTILPPDEPESHKLGLFYERQQIDILRQLAVKFKVLRHSTKSALSAIIVRNHSHHIGSHVMPRATAEKVRERLKELTYLEENTLNKIVGILKDKLDEYIQKKADFTAEIATEPLTTTKSMKFIDEVFTQFTTNTLLMDNLGANEGVRYKSLDNNRLKINLLRDGVKWSTLKYKPTTPTTRCCKKTNKPLEFPYSTHCYCGKEVERLRNKDAQDDITIALPGCLGEFAIYAFLENFIRNGIKHNKKLIDSKINGNFEVSVNVCDLDKYNKDKDEFYKLEIWDNFTKPCKKVTAKDENGNDKQIDLYLYLKGFIDLSIVNNDGTLRKEAWGMAEMKIMATLLRGSTDFTNMSKNLTVDCIEKDNEKRLVYGFYVMKPKNVAIISDKEINRQNQNQNKYGIWWFKSIDELKNHVLKGISPVSFKFLIIDKSKPGLDELKKIKPLLPFRIMITEAGDKTPNSNWYSTISKDDMCKIRNDNGEGILCITWKAWTGNCLKKKEYSDLCLFLFFQQDNETEPTKSWYKAAKKSEKELINLSILSNEKDRKASDGEDNSVIVNDPVKKKILMYDRHFWGYSCLENKQREKDIVFHEAFDKGSSDFIHIFAPYRSSEIVYELVEAALLKVLVIDERIAEVAYDELNIEDHAHRAYGGQGRLLAAKKAGVYICTHVCINNDAAPQPLHTSINNKKPIICVKFDVNYVPKSNIKVKTGVFYCEEKKCSECKGQKIDMNAVIIHQGVLENSFKETLKNNEYDNFLEALQESIPYVIVDSGRGIPAKLPDVAKFLPFSLLEDFIMKDRIAKYSLTKNIMSLTRRK